MMSIMRLLVGAGLFAFGYYLGRQSGRLEALHGEFGPDNEIDAVHAPNKGDQEKRNSGN